ncbi:MAG TPA: hypothetical protein VHE58_00245 [Burkholderiales bacterium]|nr:hypothetical protein [Burkholderiales bacterium]
MKTTITRLVAVFACLVALEAHAAELTLLCTVKMAFDHDDGSATLVENTKTVIKIDLDKRQANSDFPLGPATTPLTKLDDQWIVFVISRNHKLRNAVISSESVTINRVTGEISSFYFADVTNRGWSFIGTCETAAKKF